MYTIFQLPELVARPYRCPRLRDLALPHQQKLACNKRRFQKSSKEEIKNPDHYSYYLSTDLLVRFSYYEGYNFVSILFSNQLAHWVFMGFDHKLYLLIFLMYYVVHYRKSASRKIIRKRIFLLNDREVLMGIN